MTETRCLIWCAVSSRAQNKPDKISLPQQEAKSRALAEENGWRIVDVLSVPGHSRRYIDFHELAEDAAQKDIDAFYRLDQHWNARDFDVLIVLDGNRFARTQALHAYITEKTIEMDARIFSLIDGWVDKQNYRMWIAMNGYKSAGEIDRFVRERDAAMDARAAKGLPVSSRVIFSHKVIRDPNSGKAIRLEVDESKRRLWDDLAFLVLEGIAWDKVEAELFNQFGHANEEGEVYYPYRMRKLIMTPVFWGHMARHHRSAGSKNGYKTGPWVYDENEPIPEGSMIFRNTHPAVWEGELADRIRGELERRRSISGNASPKYTHRFSGLAICGECGHFMATHTQKNSSYRGLYCGMTKNRPRNRTVCSNRGVTNERRIIKLMDGFLRQMLEENTTDIFDDTESNTPSLQERIARLEADIDDLEEKARAVIRKQLNAAEDIQRLYDEELDKIGRQLRNMKDAVSRLQGESLNTQENTAVQQATLKELADLTLEKFWQQESRVINQMLHRLMGKRRLVILKKEVIGVVVSNRVQRKHD